MAETTKKYLGLEGLKVLWSEIKKQIDSVSSEVKDDAVDVSSLEFDNNVVIDNMGVNITLNKSNISGTSSTSTSVTIPLAGEDSAGIITDVVQGNGTTIEKPENGKVKINISVDDNSITINKETGEIEVNIINGGTF